MIVVADGPSLATAAFRKVLDAARPHVPQALGCVVDAATTGHSIALAVYPDGSATVVLVTRAVVANCPALSRIDDNVYVATIGAGSLADSRAQSMLVDARWDRARPYLLREPFALAIERSDVRAIAVAQPDPVDAWVAIDTVDAVATERAVKAALARYSAPQTIELASKFAVARASSQVTVHGDELTADELSTLVIDLAEAVERVPAATAPFECPPLGRGIVSCHDGTQLKVASVKDLVRELATVPVEPIVSVGEIVGVRFTGDPPRLLRRDDVLLGIGPHRITESRQLADLAGTLGDRAALAVRREGVEVVLILSE